MWLASLKKGEKKSKKKKKGKIWTQIHTQGTDHMKMKMGGADDHQKLGAVGTDPPSQPQREPTLPTPWSGSCCCQDWGTVNIYYLSPRVYGINTLSQQPWKIHRGIEVVFGTVWVQINRCGDQQKIPSLEEGGQAADGGKGRCPHSGKIYPPCPAVSQNTYFPIGK